MWGVWAAVSGNNRENENERHFLIIKTAQNFAQIN